jgi:hypothetical protein
MRLKHVVGLTFLMLALAMTGTGSRAQAQQAAPHQASPSVELAYAYTHTNGPPGNCGCFGLNGGTAAIVYPLQGSRVSLVGEFAGSYAGGLGSAGYDFKLFTYTAGARYSPKFKYKSLEPYAEMLVGVAHAGGTVATGDKISNAFGGSAGGGINLPVNHHLAVKLVQADYVSTTFVNGDTDHQNDFRITTGLVFSLRR